MWVEPAISLYLMLQTGERKLWPIFHPRMKQLCLWALELFSLSKNIDKEVQFLVKDIKNKTNILLMARTTTNTPIKHNKKKSIYAYIDNTSTNPFIFEWMKDSKSILKKEKIYIFVGTAKIKWFIPLQKHSQVN